MTTSLAKMPIFPEQMVGVGESVEYGRLSGADRGMTYRQFAAALAQVGMPMDWSAEDCANAARERADALIAALERPAKVTP